MQTVISPRRAVAVALTLAASLHLASAGVALAHDRPLCLPSGRVVGPEDAPIGPYGNGHHEAYEAFKQANNAREMGEGDTCVAPTTSTPSPTAVPATPTAVPATPTTAPTAQPTSTPASTTVPVATPTIAAPNAGPTTVPVAVLTSTPVPTSTPGSSPPTSPPPAPQTQEVTQNDSGPNEPPRRVICENHNGPRMVELSVPEIEQRKREGQLIADGPCPTPTRQASPTATTPPATATALPVVSPTVPPTVQQAAPPAPPAPPVAAPLVIVAEPTPELPQILGPLLVVERAPEPEATPVPTIQVLQEVSQGAPQPAPTRAPAPVAPSRTLPAPAGAQPATPLLPRTGAGALYGPGGIALALMGLGAFLSRRAQRHAACKAEGHDR